jgi:hypothetical protein
MPSTNVFTAPAAVTPAQAGAQLPAPLGRDNEAPRGQAMGGVPSGG